MLHYSIIRWLCKHWFTITRLIVLVAILFPSGLSGQSVSQWPIPGQPNIQGLDALYPEDPFNLIYFTEYDKMKIGRLTNIVPPVAMLSEWSPSGTDVFHPFKIVAGKWDFATKTADPTHLTVAPFLNSPVDVKVKDVLKYIQIGFKMWAMATFTLPDENSVGILVHSPFVGADAFWVWPTAAAGLEKPWDIQRRAISADETSCWLSNGGANRNALWQFFPATNTIQTWDFTNCKLEVSVFYVVPSAKGKGVTDIWIGGIHTDAAGKPIDCIAYMKVDSKNALALLRIWDLPTTTAENRKMNAILFTHKPTKDGFTKMQVWLSSSTVPEMTILEPNSIFTRNGVDRICVVLDPLYRSPNGLFWNDPVYTGLVTADNNRRIWITSGVDDHLIDMLSANKGEVAEAITYVECKVTPTRATVQKSVYKANRQDADLTNESAAENLHDLIPCNIDRDFWDPSTGLNVDYTGAFLDIDLQGKATTTTGANTFEYSIIWHEPLKGVVGMLWKTPPIARTIFDNPYGLQKPDEFALNQNYPNPFNPQTTISYMLPADARVSLKVYNSLGQEVATLIDNELREAGEQSIDFNSGQFPSGVYFYRINAVGVSDVEDENGEITQQTNGKTLVNVKKMMMLK